MVRKSDRRRVEELLDRFEPEVRRAFLDAIDELRNGVDLQALIRALETGNIDAALRAAHIEGAAYSGLRRAIEAVYVSAGKDAVDALPILRDWTGMKVGFRFDPDYPRAAEWVRQHSSAMITRIVEDQRESLRNALSEGLTKGTNPRAVGVEIAGKFDPRTGRRAGGIIGLTDSQRQFVANAREELTSGIPSEMGNYLTRKARDRSFDAAVIKAIAEERPVDAETLSKITGRYQDSLLKMRADMIARTETTQATSAARREAWRQTAEAAGVDDTMIERTWRATKDKRTRDSHRAMDGQKIMGLDSAYTSPSGAMLRYPGDPMAPLSEVIQCRCFETMRIRLRGRPE
ncbi:phage Mu protein F like protein [Pseudaminobacter salicylatoxidans]|uniref:Phage Mu protein F like protein n=1 Tax=Pseudaminobacter salicylatoxidans TaxID=93369 RepID=A0A316C0F1_PSESE|nr:phage minor head protein [Pseudaminobacter salicylatoxidans]PWJ81493.1 phage Mu protein F like protein [Pseudaminobacter salicylatoxidans]